MPFYRYAVRRLADGACCFTKEASVSLAGKHVIQRLARNKIGGRVSRVPWHIAEDELVANIPKGRPGESAVVIDFKPSDKAAVSLYRLRDIWGYSYELWSPLMLRLDALFSDVKPPTGESVDAFKSQFTWGPRQDGGDVVFEFIYVRGGTNPPAPDNTWLWGSMGRVNGALLWPDALESFARIILQFRGGQLRVIPSWLEPRVC